jgi:hypothetical protein
VRGSEKGARFYPVGSKGQKKATLVRETVVYPEGGKWHSVREAKYPGISSVCVSEGKCNSVKNGQKWGPFQRQQVLFGSGISELGNGCIRSQQHGVTNQKSENLQNVY